MFKNNTAYACIREPTSQKKTAKQNAAAEILEMLSTRYVFLEEKCLIPESKIFKKSDKNDKESSQKWTNFCERCFQRGHLVQNSRNSLRNKEYKK